MNFGTKGCIYCEGECNKECLAKEETVKEPTMIDDWLDEHGDPEIYKKVEKQLELEEAAEKYSLELLEAKTIQPHEKTWIKSMFIYIAKWKQERMYSEEEVYELLLKHQSAYRSAVRNTSPLDWSFDIKDWFENFKKKKYKI